MDQTAKSPLRKAPQLKVKIPSHFIVIDAIYEQYLIQPRQLHFLRVALRYRD